MKSPSKQTQYLIKCALDRICAAIALGVVVPILIAMSLVIFFSMGYPILFTQPRPGQDKRVFNFYKFRTMTHDVDKNGVLLPDDKRLTKIGQFLRKTSLDELPQLWNVLKGDMSFVGPRPLLVKYLELYSSEQIRRHNVRPGITGWAQVNGRNLLDWDKKFELDVWYVDNWSIWLDLKILLKTVLKVLKREGISQQNHATMREFQGYQSSNN